MKKRILLADDDPSVRTTLAQVLTAKGYDVLQAADGLEALGLAQTHRLDLAVLDLNMPRQNGWDTFVQLTGDNPALPIIIITGRANQQFLSSAAGVGALLEKPFEMATFLSVIRRLLTQPSDTHLARLIGEKEDFQYYPSPPTSFEKRSPGGA